jgi:hypothetical protein
MIIGIPYNKIDVLPLVDGVMVDYHTQKTNITLNLSRVMFFRRVVIYHNTLN